MSKRSSIVASETDLQAYYQELKADHLTPAWTAIAVTNKPETKAVPFVWHWRELRKRAMRAAELVGTEQAERRVLRMSNPGLQGSASNTLVANIQVVMPGEVARAHRHSASALRLIIESKGSYTLVNGERIPMYPGDLVLTPNWTWHDHANDTDEPAIWLDGLDTPLVRMLEAGFFEEYTAEVQRAGDAPDPTVAKYGTGGLRPAWAGATGKAYSPLWHYPYTQVKATLERLATQEAGSPFDGVIMEYTNPETGGPAMPTITCHVQLLQPGIHTQAHRHLCCSNYHVIEGDGYSIVGGQRLDWTDKDTFVVPSWAWHEHVNTGSRNAVLFNFSDAYHMKAIDLYREEPHPNGRQG